MTQHTLVKSSLLNHKGFTFNGEKGNTLMVNALVSLVYLPHLLPPNDVLGPLYLVPQHIRSSRTNPSMPK